MDVEDQRVLLRRIEVRRLLDEGVDFLAVEALVDDLLGRRQVELREELLVRPGDGRQAAGGGVERVEVAQRRRRGEDQGHAGAIRRRRVGDDLLIAAGDGLDGAGGHVDARQVGPALLGRGDVEGAAVPAPENRLRAAAPGWMLVGPDPLADLAVVARGQVARLASRRGADHEQVRLVVRARLVGVGETAEGDPAAVGRDGEVVEVAVEADNLPRLAAAGRDSVEGAFGIAVVRFLDMVRAEVERGAVRRPVLALFGELARGELLRLRRLLAAGGHGHGPQMAGAGGVAVAAAIEAVDRPADHADVALPLLLALLAHDALLLVLLVLRLFLLLRPPLLEVLVVGGAGEGDRLSVRRPDGIAGSLRQAGQRHRLPSARGDELDLWAVLVLLRGAHEGDSRAIRRPAGRRVVRTAGERPRRLGSVRGDYPDGRVVALLLLVDGDPDENDLLAVGRDPGIGRPHELEQVRLGDGPLVGGWQGVRGCEGEESEQDCRSAAAMRDRNHQRAPPE